MDKQIDSKSSSLKRKNSDMTVKIESLEQENNKLKKKEISQKTTEDISESNNGMIATMAKLEL